MRVIILYGEMGCGKTYGSSRVARELGMSVMEGDDYIPSEMALRIARFLPVSPEMLQEYLLGHLVPAILAWDRPGGLVVAQALYLAKHREMVAEAIRAAGHDVELRRIEAPFFRHMRQLWGRPKGFRWVLYGLLNKPFFQP